MKRLVPTLLATAALMLVVAAPVSAAGGGEGTVTVSVMKHLCNQDINNADDFTAIVEGAESPVAALAATVLACPTIVNPGDEQTDGVKSEPADFSFTVEDADGTRDLPENTQAAKLCEGGEGGLGIDVDGDGEILAETCLDISHYSFDGLVSGEITVTETEPPAGSRFGFLLTTPSEVDGNNDAESVLSFDAEAGVIELDTTPDEDGMVMLHVYNFQNEMPDSATAAEITSESAPINVGLLLALGLAATLGIWLSIGLRRREPSSSN